MNIYDILRSFVLYVKGIILWVFNLFRRIYSFIRLPVFGRVNSFSDTFSQVCFSLTTGVFKFILVFQMLIQVFVH